VHEDDTTESVTDWPIPIGLAESFVVIDGCAFTIVDSPGFAL